MRRHLCHAEVVGLGLSQRIAFQISPANSVASEVNIVSTGVLSWPGQAKSGLACSLFPLQARPLGHPKAHTHHPFLPSLSDALFKFPFLLHGPSPGLSITSSHHHPKHKKAFSPSMTR